MYEPVDTKLARSAKPLHILQLCFYAEQLERIQGRLREEVHVELGSGERESFRTATTSRFRRSREGFLLTPSSWGWLDQPNTLVTSDRRLARAVGGLLVQDHV
jgi:hypothetical protein